LSGVSLLNEEFNVAQLNNPRLLRELRNPDNLDEKQMLEKIEKILVDEGFSREEARSEAENFVKQYKSGK
jgi:hypothetical protein